MDNNGSDEIDETVYNIIKVYLAQIDSSVKISKIIHDHSQKGELTGDDIICGLIYRLMTPMSPSEIDECLKTASDILEGSESDESDEETDREFDQIRETYEKPTISRKIISNTCDCETCSRVRECLDNYPRHEPRDQLEQKFRDSIEKTCSEYKIYI